MKKIIKFISIFVFVFSFGLFVNAEELAVTDINEEGLITRGEVEGATSYKIYIQNSMTEVASIRDFTTETATLMSFLDNEAGVCNQTGVKPYGLTGKCKTDYIDTYVLDVKAFNENNEVLSSARLIVDYDGEAYTKVEGNKHLVVVVANGGKRIDNRIVDDGSLIPADALETTKGSLNLAGWYTEPEFENLFEFENPITSDISIYAKWMVEVEAFSEPAYGGKLYTGNNLSTLTNHLTTTYHEDSESLGEIQVQPNEGWTFKEWRIGSVDGTLVDNDNTKDVYKYASPKLYFKLKNSYKFYALFEPNGEVYTVTFNTNGGNEIEEQKIVSGYKATMPATPVKEDCEFMGWYANAELTQEFDFNTSITGNVTVYAKWLDSNTEYTVTFETNGGSTIDSQKVLLNQKVTKPANPTKEDNVFIGWYKDSELTEEFDFNTLITEDTTIYAKFVSNETEYNVTFVYNVNERYLSENVQVGQKVEIPEEYTEEGLEFAGWYADSEFNQVFDFDKAILKDTMIYGRWYVNVNVNAVPANAATFYAGGNPSGATASFKEKWDLDESALGEVTYVVNHGYKFKEWRLGSAEGEVLDTVNTANVYAGYNQPKVYFKLGNGYNIYAIFEKETYTVNFETNGGNEIESVNVLYGDKLAKPEEPENEMLIFKGWFTDSELTTAYDFNKPVEDNMTLYAKWVTETKITSAPKIGIADGNNNSLTLKFPKDNNIKQYLIYRSTDKKKYTLIKTINNTNEPWVNTGLTYGKTYYYKVKVKNSFGTYKNFSNVVSKKVVPNKVTLVTATSIGSNNIKLSWGKVSGNGYEVYMGTKTSNMKKIATITKNGTVTYNKTKLKANTNYYFKVRAYKTVSKKKVYGPWSANTLIKTAPAKPTLTVSYLSNKGLNIKFNSVSGAVNYVFEVSPDNKKTWIPFNDEIEFTKGGTFPADGFLKGDVTYYFRVKACNASEKCSAWAVAGKRVAPKVPSLSLKTTSKKVTVTVNKVNDVEGYVVQKKDGPKGKWKTVKTLKAEDTLKFSNKTKKGTKYYYRVRSFATIDEKLVYSDYSGAKSIKSK